MDHGHCVSNHIFLMALSWEWKFHWEKYCWHKHKDLLFSNLSLFEEIAAIFSS
jgi:hypothetical protein